MEKGRKRKKPRLDADLVRRFKYRLEFLKRSKEFERLKEELRRKHDINEIGPLEAIALTQELFPHDPLQLIHEVFEAIKDDDSDSAASFLAANTLSSIEVAFHKGREIKYSALNYFEPRFIREIGPNGSGWKDFAIGAVNKEEKTIIIKVHLDRQMGEISRDINFLLKILDREAKRMKIPLTIKKNPQWDIYDKYIQVFDLKKKDPKMEWPEIAKKVFPQEVSSHQAPHRKTRKSELPSQTAVGKVRHYWVEAKKMIDGGWKQI